MWIIDTSITLFAPSSHEGTFVLEKATLAAHVEHPDALVDIFRLKEPAPIRHTKYMVILYIPVDSELVHGVN